MQYVGPYTVYRNTITTPLRIQCYWIKALQDYKLLLALQIHTPA